MGNVHDRRALVVLAISTCLAVALTGTAEAKDAHPGQASKHSTKHKKSYKKSTKSKPRATGATLNAVPAEQATLFAALRQPARTALPTVIARRLTDGPPDIAALGLDAGQARQVGAGGSTFYIVPGKAGLCLFLSDGGSICSTRLDQVARDGLSVSIVPAAPGPVSQMKSPVGPGTVTTYGIVPDGVSRVTATSTSGTTSEAVQSGNAYVLKTDGPFLQKIYSGPNLAPYMVQ